MRPMIYVIFVFVVGHASWVQANDEPHVVVVVGTHHYSANRSMPRFAEELTRLGFRTTVVMGEGDPEKKTKDVLPGIDALDDADLAFFYVRFLNLPQQIT